MTMLDLSPVQTRALDHIVCVTCGGSMEHGTEAVSCLRCGTSYPVDADGIIRTLSTLPGRMNLAVRMGQWQGTAALYDRAWRGRALGILTGEAFSVEREIDIVADSMQVKNGKLFLDNACANGYYARNIARRLIRDGQEGVIFAIDASLPMLRKAKQLAVKEGVADRIVFVHAVSEKLPFADGTFDGIMCGGSLNEFVSPDDVLRELRRVLNPRSGGFSLMFQVQGRRGLKVLGQALLGAALGLHVWTLGEAIEKVRTYFEPEIRFHGGMILMLRCTSRVRTIADEPKLRFAPAA